MVYLFYNKCSDWSVTGTDQQRQSNKSSDWYICYVTSVLIGLLQVPINDDKATSLLIGLSLETRKEHIVRAVLESLAFRFTLLYETLLNETKTRMSFLIRCDLVISYNNVTVVLSPASDRQHLSYDVCLEVRGEIIRTVLCTEAVHSYKYT